MKVILYFDKPLDLTQGFRAVEEVSKNFNKISVTLASREKIEFGADGQIFFVCALNELSLDDFDCIICSNDSLKINFPSEKIFTPEQFIKNFSEDNTPLNYYSLPTRIQSIMTSLRSILFLRLRRIPKPSSKLRSRIMNILHNNIQI